MLEGTLRYSEFGDARKPTIVCLHGLAGNGLYSFGELVPYLEENFHLIILDNPGHGKTPAFDKEDDYLFSNLATWLYQAIKEIVADPFYLLGHSWGADMALHFTRFYPDSVLGLIMLDGGFTFPHNQPEMTFNHAYTGWNTYMEQAVYGNEEEIFQENRSYTKRWNASKEHYVLSLFNQRSDGEFELAASNFTVLAIIKAFFKEPFAAAYPFIKSPTLLIYANQPESQQAAREQGILQLKENIEDLAVVMVEDSSHMVQWDEPEYTASLIADWKNKIIVS
ncbi:alpha/beta fold hydrolase [Planococcus sp. CAU13]|uniref:alpha/beta fold hydrolase n=1 Tax=Planococcus sp. CAU13 TaxID=1541197 RepID=UPI00052FDE67|nr:alpha/beta hydrolase [Planococcus sp. CAU13]